MTDNPLVNEVRCLRSELQIAQANLLELCRDKQYNINERYKIWVELVNKEEYSDYMEFHEGDVPELLVGYHEGLEERHEDHDYGRLLDYAMHELDLYNGLDTKQDYKVWGPIYHKRYDEAMTKNPKILEIKEWLIQENFGSFTFDW